MASIIVVGMAVKNTLSQFALAALAFMTCSIVITPASGATATFNFDSDLIGTTTPFADTNNSVTASFSSPLDPNAFSVSPSIFTTLTGNVLLSANGSKPLQIIFDQPIIFISIAYALIDPQSTGSISLSIPDNGGTSAGPGAFPPGVNSEGILGFGAGCVCSFHLYLVNATAPNFAIDNIVVTTAETPLPATLPLFATGLVALGLFGWRRKTKTVCTWLNWH